MAVGIVLLILGAVFTFALKAESSWLDLRVFGVILMLGGVAFMTRSRMTRREVVTRETESGAGAAETEETSVVERHME